MSSQALELLLKYGLPRRAPQQTAAFQQRILNARNSETSFLANRKAELQKSLDEEMTLLTCAVRHTLADSVLRTLPWVPATRYRIST